MSEPEVVEYSPSPEPVVDQRIAILQSEAEDPAAAEMAFASIVTEFEPGLKSYVSPIVGNRAEDVVQETFIKAWRGIGSFVPEAEHSFAAWLFRIARNAAIDGDRGERRFVNGRVISPVEDLAVEASHEFGDPVARADFTHILSIIGQLDESNRELLRLRTMGLSYDEISDETGGLSRPAIAGRLHRTRRAARHLLGEHDVL